MKKYWVGVSSAVTGIIVLSPDSLLVRLIHLDSGALLFWRGLLLFLSVSAIGFAQQRGAFFSTLFKIGKPDLIAAILFAINSAFFVHSIRCVSSVASTLIIIGVAPLLAALLGFLLLGERPSRRTMLTLVIVLSGIGLIFINDFQAINATLGNLYALGMAICLAINIVLVRSSTQNPALFLAVAGIFLASGAIFFAHSLIPDVKDMAPLLIMGSVAVPVGFVLIMTAPKHLEAGEVGLIMLLEAFFGPLWVWLWLAEVPSKMTAIAGGIVLVTLCLHYGMISIKKPRKTDVATSTPKLTQSESTALPFS